MEHIVSCRGCDWSQAWTTEQAAMGAALWHLHDEHPGLWPELVKFLDPDLTVLNENGEPIVRPETFGRQFENWERQS